MLRLKKEDLLRVWIIIKSPVVMLLLGGLISYIFYILSINDKGPSYSISKKELVAKITEDAGRMSIIWDSVKYDNLYFVRLTIWNSGSQYIDCSDFVKSYLPRLYNTGRVKILSISEQRVSRPNLTFENLIINKDSVNPYAQFRLLNDEALEENDGIEFHVLYNENSEGDWIFEGRVKGTTDGFIEKDLNQTGVTTDRNSVYILWVIIILLIISRVIVFWLKKKDVVFRDHEVVFLILLLSITIYLTYKYMILNTYLPWY